ncbi:DUF397 domain-containing protein [Streptomyces sp. CA-181903]|uniref:DUF397 domain-containing protein n=1 Tax=Streptomyces sp. CA-181903 TaxID=3240055 RepID=UPI003D8C0C5F
MPSPSELHAITWRSSSYSMEEDQCLQVSDQHSGLIPVRDSKTPTGPTLTLPTPAWSAFVTALTAEGGLAPR